MFDFENLMKMAGEVKERMRAAQADAASIRATGEAGGGLVQATVTGRNELVQLTIDPKLLNVAEKSLLEDLICAAVNQAMVKVSGALQAKMAGMAKDMGVSPSMLEQLMGQK